MRRLTGRPTIAKEKSVLVDSLQKQEGGQANGRFLLLDGEKRQGS
jgi:hypothetical protein